MKKKILLDDLIKAFTWDQIKDIIYQLSCDDCYSSKYEELEKMYNMLHNKNFEIEEINEDILLKVYKDTIMVTTSRQNKVTYDVSCEDWAIWLGMFVHPQTLAYFDPEIIIATCIIRMTVYGFDQEKLEKIREKVIWTTEQKKLKNR